VLSEAFTKSGTRDPRQSDTIIAHVAENSTQRLEI